MKRKQLRRLAFVRGLGSALASEETRRIFLTIRFIARARADKQLLAVSGPLPPLAEPLPPLTEPLPLSYAGSEITELRNPRHTRWDSGRLPCWGRRGPAQKFRFARGTRALPRRSAWRISAWPSHRLRPLCALVLVCGPVRSASNFCGFRTSFKIRASVYFKKVSSVASSACTACASRKIWNKS